MKRRNEYSSSEGDEESRRQRRIRRLEKKLEREKRRRRQVSPNRSSRRRSTSNRPRNRSRRSTPPTPKRYYERHRSPTRSQSRYSRRRSSTRSRSRYSRRRSSSESRSSYSARRVSKTSARRCSSSKSSQGSRENSSRRSVSNHESARRLSARRDAEDRVDEIQRGDALPINNEKDATIPIGGDGEAGVVAQVPIMTEKSQIDDASATIPEHEVELLPDVLEVIGARLESDKKFSAAVHKDIALRWAEILRNGLPAEEVKKLLEKHPPPENCSFISVPKLNAEIIAAVQETAVKRDKRIVEKQERIAACLSVVGRAFSIVLKMEGTQRLELLENLSEGGRLLASVHREESLARKSLILANLNSSLKSTLSNTKVDEWLFSADLEGLIKSAKTLERTSKDLKPPSKPLQQKKNWKGPARQPPYKGRSTMSGAYRGRSSYHSDPKKQPYRKEGQRYKRRR